MTRSDLAILHAGTTLAGLALFGLLARRKARRCLSFVAYLAAVAGGSLLSALHPVGRSWIWWLGIETLQALLALLVAFELAARTLRALPSASAAAQRALRVLLALTALSTLLGAFAARATLRAARSPEVLAFEVSSAVLPYMTYGAALLFTALLALANWYLLPVDPLHRAILVGFSAYLVLFSALTVSVRSEDRRVQTALSRVNSGAYLLLLAGWSYRAWRVDPLPPAPEALVRRLWPWR